MTKAALRLSATCVAALAATPAFAHHAMDGAVPTTWFQGVVTGLAHPIIGIDHLAFVVAVGLLAALAGARVLIPLAFVAGTLAGCLIALGGVEFAATEWLILASVLLGGLTLALGLRNLGPAAIIAVAFAGLFHGMAYAGGIIGAETAPLLAYLVGFALVQIAIALGVMLLARVALRTDTQALGARIAGGVVFGIGLAFTIEGIEALVFAGAA